MGVAKSTSQSDRPLQGRVALVTGSSRGIGRDIILTLAKAGCSVVIAAKSITDSPNLPGTIHTVAAEARALGVDALPVRCDVRDDAQISAMFQAIDDTFGRLDFLVCNSGALWLHDVERTPMSRFDLVHSINVRATFACVRAALPLMRRNNFGSIVVMSPPIDLLMLKGKVAYSISKFGMTMIAHGLARELKGTGISINALWPVTLVESFATKNFHIGEAKQWRKASILSDTVLLLFQEKPEALTGHALFDEGYLRSKGVTDFEKYQCVPGYEPKRAITASWTNLMPQSTSGLPPGISARM